MNQSPVIEGFWKGTILVTILAMIFGVALGVVLAVMRLSDNPVLKGVVDLHLVLPAIPLRAADDHGCARRLLTAGLAIGVPFDWKIIDWPNLSGSWRFATLTPMPSSLASSAA